MEPEAEQAARAAAQQLADRYGTGLAAEVEAQLQGGRSRERFLADPIAIASLIVGAVQLALAVYGEIKKAGGKPTPPAIALRVRTHSSYRQLSSEHYDVIDVVAEQVVEQFERPAQS